MYDRDNFIVLGLSGSGLFGGESQTTISAFRDQTGVTFPLLLGDNTYSLHAEPDGQISPYPLNVIVDKTGTIRYVSRQHDGPGMKALIDQAVAE